MEGLRDNMDIKLFELNRELKSGCLLVFFMQMFALLVLHVRQWVDF